MNCSPNLSGTCTTPVITNGVSLANPQTDLAPYLICPPSATCTFTFSNITSTSFTLDVIINLSGSVSQNHYVFTLANPTVPSDIISGTYTRKLTTTNCNSDSPPVCSSPSVTTQTGISIANPSTGLASYLTCPGGAQCTFTFSAFNTTTQSFTLDVVTNNPDDTKVTKNYIFTRTGP
jgi:hypothetical protein